MIRLDVLKYKKYAFLFSVLFIVAGVIVFIVAGGFNKGIDFGSGYSETFQIAPLGFSVLPQLAKAVAVNNNEAKTKDFFFIFIFLLFPIP